MGLFDSVRNLFGGGDETDAALDDETDAALDDEADASTEDGAATADVPDAPDTSNGAAPADQSAVDESADELRAEFRPYAQEFAADWSDYGFDFSANSLTRLDEFVDNRWEKDRFTDAEFNGDDDGSREFTGIVVRTGSYFGETLVHSLDADWVDDEDFGAAVRVYGDEEDAVVNVFHIAAGCLREPSTFAETYERATEDV